MAEILDSEPSTEHCYGIVPIRLINPPSANAPDGQLSSAALSTRTTQVLLIHQKSLTAAKPLIWCFPKGHPESGDASPLHTALREVAEETGLPVKEEGILFRDAEGLAERYRSSRKGLVKEVRYWVGLIEGHEEPVVQEKEVGEARWLSYEDALKLVTVERARGVLLRTMELLDGGKSKV
jgi:8-oxo-dGTP pyrophosphatase MutT (NUDIX family)